MKFLHFYLKGKAKVIVFHVVHGSEACCIHLNKWTMSHVLRIIVRESDWL